MDKLIEKRLPFAQFQFVDGVFAATALDTVIPHALSPRDADEVEFIVVDAPVAANIYRGSKAPGLNFIVLRSSATGTFRLLLIIESNLVPL